MSTPTSFAQFVDNNKLEDNSKKPLTIQTIITAFEYHNNTEKNTEIQHKADIIKAEVKKILPLATANKLKKLNQDITFKDLNKSLDKKIGNEFDDFAHDHFGIFTNWYNGYCAIISACFGKTKHWIQSNQSKQDKQLSNLWVLATILILPLILVPIIIYIQQLALNIKTWLAKCYQQATHGENQVLKAIKLFITIAISPILIIMPIFFDTNEIIEEHFTNKQDLTTNSYPIMKALARIIVIFAALGTGFIALTAILSANSPLAFIGIFAWLFFVAGFLSEFQSLEKSVYFTMCKLAKHKTLIFGKELETKIAISEAKYWGIKNPEQKSPSYESWEKIKPSIKGRTRQKKQFQIVALFFAGAIGLSMFALAFTHTQSALALLAAATSPWWLAPLTIIIATATAVAWACMVYRILRDAIHDKDGNNFITLWAKYVHESCTNLLTKPTKWYQWITKPLMPFFYLAIIVLTIFYVVTAAPAFRQATQIFRSAPVTWLLSSIYYIAMSIYYAGACQKSCEEIKNYFSKSTDLISTFVGKLTKSIKAAFKKASKWYHYPTIVVLGSIEFILKISCFLILHLGLTLGLFALHLIGDAAIGSEEPAPLGLTEKLVLVLNSLSHFLSDIGFILEWSTNHNHDGNCHSHETAAEDSNLNNKVNIIYALLCLTIVIPLIHVIIYKIRTSLGSTTAKHPNEFLYTQESREDQKQYDEEKEKPATPETPETQKEPFNLLTSLNAIPKNISCIKVKHNEKNQLSGLLTEHKCNHKKCPEEKIIEKHSWQIWIEKKQDHESDDTNSNTDTQAATAC